MKTLLTTSLVVAALVGPAMMATAASAKGHITVRKARPAPMMPGYYSYGYGSYNPPFYSYAILAPLLKPLF